MDPEGGPMPRISTQEFERLPLRVHAFLAGVPLHDVWAIDLPHTRSGITLDEFSRTTSLRSQVGCDCCENDSSGKAHLFTRSPVVRALLNIRFFVGRLLGLDREPAATAWETFTMRLTTADRSKSLAPAGTLARLFHWVFPLQNAQTLALINRTA